MAWTNLSFSYGSLLTSTKVTQMYDNLFAIAAGTTGALKVQPVAIDHLFSTWSSGPVFSTTYTASTDGFVVAGYSGGSSRVRFMMGFTQTTTGTPGVVKAMAGISEYGGLDYLWLSGFCMPVRKGDRWRVVETNVIGAGGYSTYGPDWISIQGL